MSNKKAASRITLGMLKGKSLNTSVPSISVRFNATAEEIEELYQSEDDSSEQTNSEQTKSAGDLESSPLKYLPRLAKRSASTDNTLTVHDSSPTSDPWKFFTEIKGKITKNIEEKITEIKHRNEECDGINKKRKELIENYSDSEDISESSLSKTCGVASTTEEVEMSSDEDTSSLDKEKKLDVQLEKPSSDISISNVRKRVRIIRKGTEEMKGKESLVTLNTLGKLIELQTGVNPSGSRQLVSESMEIESGIEALEDNQFQSAVNFKANVYEEEILPEQLIVDIADKIDNLEVEQGNSIIIQPVTGEDIRKTFTQQNDNVAHSYFAPAGFVDLRGRHLYHKRLFNLVYSFRRFLLVVCFIVLYIYGPIPVYFSGFIAGLITAVTLMMIYSMFFSDNAYTPGYFKQPLVTQNELLLTVPEIKEHIPITTHEGWMNEYPDEYNPLTYHISRTQSVYVKLQGNLLRISHTRTKIPKRAMWDEPKHKMLFTQHRIYNMLGAKVMLLPEALHRKRQWSKKYPICIVLQNDQLNLESNNFVEEQLNNDNGKKQNSGKTKQKKKVNEQPQIYSKLNDESLYMDYSLENSEVLSELEQSELESLGMKLNENLLDDEDFLSHNLPDEEQVEEDVIDSDDWTTFSAWESPTETYLFLFGRTGREKEDWFRRLAFATHKGPNIFAEQHSQYDTQINEANISESLLNTTYCEADYLKYMSQFIKVHKRKTGPIRGDEYLRAANVLWINAVMGRVLYDWSKDYGFTDMLKEKIQKKLMTIKLPYFIEQLNVYQLSLGDTSPLINNAGPPVLDQRGLWVDLDMSYQGNIVLTLQTKLNLMKLKYPHCTTKESTIYDFSAKWKSSDVEDTAESSTDDDGQIVPIPKVFEDKGLPIQGSSGTKSTKLMRVVDKITESKIFQAATDNRYIKKAMEGVSNTDLSLKVEVKGLIGTLAINIPPPPTDRLWIGFRPAPQMLLTAQPMVGIRNISFIKYFTNWIEKKLYKEFQKLLVIPNMEDFVIPNMSSELPK